MKNLNISVVDKIAKYLQRDGAIVCGNSGKDSGYQITFTFDSEWDAYETKTARFIWNGKYWDQPFSGNVCPVPKITNAVFVLVGVYAGDLSTTTPASIPCKRSILCDDVEINDGCVEGLTEQAVEAAYRAEVAAARVEAILSKFDNVSVLGYVDEDKNIILTGSLPETKYTVKYEMSDGSTIDIGELDFDGSDTGGGSGGTVEPTVISISASKTTTSYTAGDTLNTNDITVTATYSDGSTKTVTDYTVNSSAVQMGTAGTYNLVVSYGGVNTTISIKVAEKAVEETHTNLAGTLSSGRLSSSASGYVNSDTPNARVTDYIAIEQGDIITVKGFDKSQPTVFAYMVFTSSKTRRVGPIKVLSETSEYVNISDVTSESYKAKITSTADDVSYIRFGGFPTGSESNIVVNIQHSNGTWE